jgi:hypothetical protein
MAIGQGGISLVDRLKAGLEDRPALWINVARAWAIVAAVGVLYSPTVATVALITTYVAFVASGQAVVRLIRGKNGRPGRANSFRRVWGAAKQGSGCLST